MTLAGQRLFFRACIVVVKTDWMELATSIGLPPCNDGTRPCFKCNATSHDMCVVCGCSLVELPWRQNEEGEYFNDCTRCEIVVALDADDHARIESLLADDKRSSGSHGRSLLAPVLVDGKQLLKGDRLEPCEAVPSVECFSNVTMFPLVGVTFWRRSLESMTRHRNPMFDPLIGLTPKRCLAVDSLHAFYLGYMKTLLQHIVWYILLSFPYGKIGTLEESLLNNMAGLSQDLLQFYKAYDKAHPGRKLTRIERGITSHLVGSRAEKKMASKGAETFGLLLFVGDYLERNLRRFSSEARDLMEAAQSTTKVVDIWRVSTYNMLPADMSACFDLINRAFTLTEGVDDLNTPKKHLVTHLFYDMQFLGNPRFYSNFYDESLNKLLKSFCRLVSQDTFEYFLLLRMRDGLRIEASKRKAHMFEGGKSACYDEKASARARSATMTRSSTDPIPSNTKNATNEKCLRSGRDTATNEKLEPWFHRYGYI